MRFDHGVNILHAIPGAGREAIPGRIDVGGHKEPAVVVPPTTASGYRAVICACVEVDVQRRKFHPVVRHRQKRMSVAQQVVDAASSTMHNIGDDVLALFLARRTV